MTNDDQSTPAAPSTADSGVGVRSIRRRPARDPQLIGTAAPSPAGPLDPHDVDRLLVSPPQIRDPRLVQLYKIGLHHMDAVESYRQRYGDVFGSKAMPDMVLVNHPDHVKSLFTAKEHLAPSIANESLLAQLIGHNTVLTANGKRHTKQRKLLMPPFHGEAMRRYQRTIDQAAAQEIDTWPVDREFALAPRMSAITLSVIMAGIFGIEGRPAAGTPEHRLRQSVRALMRAVTWKSVRVAEALTLGKDDPIGPMKWLLKPVNRAVYEVITARRQAIAATAQARPAGGGLHDAEVAGHDILSILIAARTEDDEALTDTEIRDELMGLIIAGHETTANTLAWTWERVLRHPEIHRDLVEDVRSDADAARPRVDAILSESMRIRPVIPFMARRVSVPWQLGDFVVPPNTPVAISAVLAHHRPDVYPDPFRFRPERWYDNRPGAYTHLPFGGGNRRCLGVSLAMAEMTSVMTQMTQRLDLTVDNPASEKALSRNVTLVPQHGALVRVVKRH